MDKNIASVKRKFVASIVLFALAAVLGLGIVLYETNTIRFSDDVSSEELHTVVEDNEDVVAYLEQEKDFEAHFITIANLIRQDQQQSLGRSMIIITIPVLAVTGLVGYLIARRLLKPVQEAHESQERFIQDAAHELRNPLAAMSASAQNAKAYMTSAKQKAFLLTMRRQTKRLVRISEDLLFLEKRIAEDVPEPVNISELLRDVLEDLQAHIHHKNLKLETAVDDGIMLKIREQDFILLAKNIIENAVKYSHKGKKIKVSLSNGGHPTLMVSDQGIGIPVEALSHVGERFYRAENAGKHDGTGLGLAIVKKIVDRYGGKLDVKSQQNKGTTVSVRF